MRDLDFLRDEEKAPLEFNSARQGYELTDATFHLPPVTLSRREVFSFSIARRLLQAFEGTPLAMDMRSVLGKIAGSLEGTVTLNLEGTTDEFTVLREDYARVDTQTWQSLARHVNRKERARLTYQRFDGATRTYLLEPLHLLAYHGNWYVLARNVAAGRCQTFALSRCRALAPTGEHFERPPNFDAGALFRDAFGISQADTVWKVRLLFSPAVATYIKERVWHPSQLFRERRDGSLEMRLQTSSRKEIARWILSWMPEVRVLGPGELRKRINAKLSDGLARNRGAP